MCLFRDFTPPKPCIPLPKAFRDCLIHRSQLIVFGKNVELGWYVYQPSFVRCLLIDFCSKRQPRIIIFYHTPKGNIIVSVKMGYLEFREAHLI